MVQLATVPAIAAPSLLSFEARAAFLRLLNKCHVGHSVGLGIIADKIKPD